MALKIIKITLVFAIAIFGIVMFVDAASNLFISLILLSTLIFSIFLLSVILKKFRTEFKPIQNAAINYQPQVDDQTSSWRKISESPFFFGLEKKLISPNEFYFDEQHLYAVNEHGHKATFPLTAIIELSGTSVTISNRRIWKIKIISATDDIEFRFAPNYTLWNKSFEIFYKEVKRINPNAIKSKWSLWRM